MTETVTTEATQTVSVQPDTTTVTYTTVTSYIPEQTSTAPEGGTVVGYYTNPSNSVSTVTIVIPRRIYRMEISIIMLLHLPARELIRKLYQMIQYRVTVDPGS